MPHGLVHESEEKLRAHFLHTGTPSATGLYAQFTPFDTTQDCFVASGWALMIALPSYNTSGCGNMHARSKQEAQLSPRDRAMRRVS